jgi:hypothetical protein
VSVKKCEFPVWFFENLKYWKRNSLTSIGILKNVVTVVTNFPDIIGLSKQQYSAINLTGLKVLIITSRQILCIFGNMCLLSGKTTEMPLNLRMMETIRPSM